MSWLHLSQLQPQRGRWQDCDGSSASAGLGHGRRAELLKFVSGHFRNPLGTISLTVNKVTSTKSYRYRCSWLGVCIAAQQSSAHAHCTMSARHGVKLHMSGLQRLCHEPGMERGGFSERTSAEKGLGLATWDCSALTYNIRYCCVATVTCG